MSNIMVSVCCTAYNHEKYIEKTILSILEQKTNFPYEIIIHDDASTDSTADIIRQYAERYPDKIVPIIQSENKHSKGIRVTREIIVPRARGKYLAFCEGDDFWNDENKLQMQIDVLEANQDISMCCHANRRIRAKNDQYINTFYATIQKNGFIDEHDCLSEGNFPHLTSMVLRTEDYRNMPALFMEAPVGDYPLRAYALSIGKVYYIHKAMSTYRVMSPSSWSKKYRYNAEYRYNANKKMDGFLTKYDEYSRNIYHEYISRLIERKGFVTAIFTGHYEEARASALYSSCGMAKKLLIWLGLRNRNLALKLGYLYSHIKNELRP